MDTFASEPNRDVPLGLYLHIPFCRKRCKFCYFRVYTNQNASAIEQYVESLGREIEILGQQPAVQGRQLNVVYFGGGTPSYLGSKQLLFLRDTLRRTISWDHAEEVTFECEPGTMNLEKVKTLKEIGVTRVSLGVENFNDAILEENGRAHLSPEVYRAYDWLRQIGFPQINIDLIAGMIGETDENWHRCIDEVLKLEPDNITIYQMELPFNTLISKDMREHGITSPVADWPTKRRWVSEAFDRCLSAGYQISSGNELVKCRDTDRFVYRDNLFRGTDLLAAGVSSFGHIQGVHYQNLDRIVKALRRRDQFDNTLILFLSDNGSDEVRGPLWGQVCNTPFRKFKVWVHDGGIASPFIAHWPAGIPASQRGTIVTGPAHIMDLFPTCLAAATAKHPHTFAGHAVQPLEGASLLPALQGLPFPLVCLCAVVGVLLTRCREKPELIQLAPRLVPQTLVTGGGTGLEGIAALLRGPQPRLPWATAIFWPSPAFGARHRRPHGSLPPERLL